MRLKEKLKAYAIWLEHYLAWILLGLFIICINAIMMGALIVRLFF
jgi:hypothetical protein